MKFPDCKFSTALIQGLVLYLYQRKKTPEGVFFFAKERLKVV